MKPRGDQQPYLDRVLTPGQVRQLRKWLEVDKISYRAASLRLKEQFQIQASTAQLCRWYQKTCQPRPAAPSWNGRPVVFDLRIFRRGNAWQFLLLQRTPGLKVFFQGKPLKGLARTRRTVK